MKRISILFVALIYVFAAFGQKAVIDFEVKNYDFGKINESAGKATYVFKFTNRGNSPLVVNRVQASCGCTTPTWTKEPIEPGKTGSIEVSYNPSGRPGVFNKSITVYSNASEEQTTLFIKGEVLTQPKTEADNYPVSVNNEIRLKSKTVLMNNIEKGKSSQRTMEFLNSGSSPMKISVINLPLYITYTVNPQEVKPNETGVITFIFDSKKANKWGPVTDEAMLMLNGQKKTGEEYKINIASNIIENFASMTQEQRQKAPILETPERTINLGSIKSGQLKQFKIKLGNKGINPLELRRVINNNKEIIVHTSKLSVASGKSGLLSGTVDTKGMNEGEYKKTLTIQTNDPNNSLVMFVISWKVQK